MSLRIFPKWEDINESSTYNSHEKAFLRYLDDHLPKDLDFKESQKLENYNGWLIFSRPYFGGFSPSVVVFHPSVGLYIYDFSFVEKRNKESSISKNPLSKVEHYRTKLISQLMPNIGEAIDLNKGILGTISLGVFFPFIPDSEQVHGFVETKGHQFIKVFTSKSLDNTDIKGAVPKAFHSYSLWNKEWNKQLLFWLSPQRHNISEGVVIRLKGSQIKLGQPSPGHHRVRGIAGSGKSQALAFRAARLAAQGNRVLVISFNITLWHYLREIIGKVPENFDWTKISFNHFHGFCKDVLNECGFTWPSSPKGFFNSYQEEQEATSTFFRETIPNAVRMAVSAAEFSLKFDAILIDEGQDYHFEWYSMLNDLFLSPRDELVVVSDKKQNIYERKLDWLDKRGNKSGLEKFKDVYIELTSSFRMPAAIAKLANDFSDSFNMNQDLKMVKVEASEQLFKTNHIVWLQIKESQWLNLVISAFRRLKQEQSKDSDIVVLVPTHDHGLSAVESFRNINVEVNHIFEVTGNSARFNKKSFWLSDPRIKLCTIHSFKGWELANIILFIPESHQETNERFDSLVYTALTRAKENLIVLNAHDRYETFGEKYPSRWEVQSQN